MSRELRTRLSSNYYTEFSGHQQIMQGEPHTDPRMLEMSDWGGHIDPHDLQLS